MLVLLPPSEGKTAPRRGPALDLAALSSPGLTDQRRRVLAALVAASARDDAAAVLGVGPGLLDEVRRNAALPAAATAPAARVYTGVLYAAAGLDRLTPAQRRRAAESVRVVSALWGVVTPDDPIPAYRLSMGTDLPGVGPLAPAWRAALGTALDDQADGLVVDARSAAYLAAWHPPRGTDWVCVRVERDADGVRQVVSHHAKHTRGVLTRHLLVRRARPPRDADALAHAAAELLADGTLRAVELGRPVTRGARTLTLVVG